MKKIIKQIIPEQTRKKYRQTKKRLTEEMAIVIAKIQINFKRPPFPQQENGETYLHLGCGSINHPQFINIDGRPAPHIHYIRKLEDLSCFDDETVNLIYACHCLEHFSHRQVPQVLQEWFRVLKPDGILRISVPNFDFLVDIYQDNQKDLKSILGILMGGQDYQYNFHLTAFNESSLKDLLIDTGFQTVQQWEPGSSDLTTFNDCSGRKHTFQDKLYPISLNLEGIK